jgi:hypothetical protein
VALMRALALAAAVVLAVIWTRAATSASAELDAANAARAAGRIDEAIERYQYALRWYTPFAEAPQFARRALEQIASEAQARGDRATAIDALQRLRGGVRAISGHRPFFDDEAPTINRRLAGLLAQEQLAQGAPLAAYDRVAASARLQSQRLRELNSRHEASLGGSLLIVIAFAAWLAGAVFTIHRGLDRDARVLPGFALGGALWTVGWFALWLLGLSQA